MTVDCGVLDEIFVGNLASKFLFRNEYVIFTWFDDGLLWPSCVTSLLFEDSLPFSENLLNECVLTYA